MRSSLGLRFPVATVATDTAATPITTGAWLQLVAALPAPASALEIFNPSNSPVQVSQGGPGNETAADKLLPITIMPGGTTGLIPVEIAKGLPVTVRALDANISVGRFIVNFYA